MKALIPARCTLCTSRRQSSGKVFDLHSFKKSDILYYAQQHCKGQQHRRLVAQRKDSERTALRREEKECVGMKLHDPRSPLHKYLHHFKVWLAWKADGSGLEKHVYSNDKATGECTLRHKECSGMCPPVVGQDPVCDKCLSLNLLKKNLVKSALKKFAAELLYVKIFEADEAQVQCIEHIKADILWDKHSSLVQKVLNLATHELQQWVRSSFLSVRVSHRNEVLSSFLSSIVYPSLKINLTTAKLQKPLLLNVQASFEQFLARPDLSDLERIRVMVAEASIKGRLETNPLIQGLIMTCLRVAEREEKGLEAEGITKGRISKSSIMHSDAAKELAHQAGKTLCLVSRGNRHLLKLFGAGQRPFSNGKENYSKSLQTASLPVPFDALDVKGKLASNIMLIDQKLSALSDCSGRNWLAITIKILPLPCLPLLFVSNHIVYWVSPVLILFVRSSCGCLRLHLFTSISGAACG